MKSSHFTKPRKHKEDSKNMTDAIKAKDIQQLKKKQQ